MNVLETTFAGVKLKNPVITASGTFGFGEEYNELYDVGSLGAITGKGLTLLSSEGNDGVRVWETPSGMLNSVGLQNIGVRKFVEQSHKMRRFGTVVIANLGGHSTEEYLEAAEILNAADIDILELNVSCPNIKSGGMQFGANPELLYKLTAEVKEITRFPMIVKLTPNARNIVEAAQAAESAGAEGVSLVNTFLGMAIDTESRKAVFDNVYAGLSGAAIMPIALRMVHQVAKAVKIDVLGMGGICTTNDALQFIMAGAKAVAVGSACFANPTAPLQIIEGLNDYCAKHGLKNIGEIRGIV
ncbi:MAG: dihydroorotate dehydrogenase [Clostridia bacterium]|nr:dihydroorotate dehydrogenase [Clostridia bacterium]